MRSRCIPNQGELMTFNVGDVPIPLPGELSHVRALDVLDQQRRRILDLVGLVAAGQRTLQQSTVALDWRSTARLEFEVRLSDLHRALARSSGALQAALAECDRARELLRASLTKEPSVAEREKDFIGYLAGATRR
jgi:hypothetical protein